MVYIYSVYAAHACCWLSHYGSDWPDGNWRHFFRLRERERRTKRIKKRAVLQHSSINNGKKYLIWSVLTSVHISVFRPVGRYANFFRKATRSWWPNNYLRCCFRTCVFVLNSSNLMSYCLHLFVFILLYVFTSDRAIGRVSVAAQRGRESVPIDGQYFTKFVVDSSWNVMAHGDARVGKWKGNWRMHWVASTLHTTSEHGPLMRTPQLPVVDWTGAPRPI